MKDNKRFCDGGCGKEFENKHPNARVTCLPCSMESSKETRKQVKKNFEYLKNLQAGKIK